jgi:hypothetical protein
MRFRTYKNTDLRVSEVGFGLWTISTGWWGQFTEGEAIALMHKALDLGVTLYDAADTYGNGLSEELIAKAFPKQRDEIVIATKVGYDFVTHGESRPRWREIRRICRTRSCATDAALKPWDRPDRSAAVAQRSMDQSATMVWTALEKLASGRFATALPSARGRLAYEGVNCIHERHHQRPAHLQHARATPGAPGGRDRSREGYDVHSGHAFSGMLEGKYTPRQFSRRTITATIARAVGC